MAMVNTPEKITSLTKWRPKATRKALTEAPKTAAPASAKGLICGGARMAGATVQKAWLASPETKEQLRRQSPPGCHHGTKDKVPANCCTWFGRGRPQLSFKTTLVTMPGPMRNEAIRNTTTEGCIRIGKVG